MKKKNIILRIKNRLKQYRTQIFCFYDTILMNKKIKSKHNKNRIYIFGSPNQVNLGDQAQTYKYVTPKILPLKTKKSNIL